MNVFVSQYEIIILDFDGTLVESVGIKDDAFKELFSEFPTQIDEIMQYHMTHNATIRFEKFKHIYENILKRSYTPQLKRDLSAKFSELVFDKIIKCRYVAGAREFLDYYHNTIPLYLVSMSPENELRRILDARKLTGYFKKIYSSEWKKTEALKDISRIENKPYEKVVFIGDTYEDYLAAHAVEIFFIGRNSKKPFFDTPIPVFDNLLQIKHYLDRESI